ncbi:hypothetical protein DFH07DRAFT_777895 [Mycena maculata]|uniref:Uncharacterized protein n=1 Tax=Mycena maculata TaxID=230809 RepID=A0AAD7N184_9AGAR|nr:hypothetical protein DFH07DRAFT_777895 [Mycena maculata]
MEMPRKHASWDHEFTHHICIRMQPIGSQIPTGIAIKQVSRGGGADKEVGVGPGLSSLRRQTNDGGTKPVSSPRVGDVRRWTWGGQLRDVGFGRERDVRGVGWVAGGQLHDTGPGRDKCERHGEHQATVDPRHHMGAALCSAPSRPRSALLAACAHLVLKSGSKIHTFHLVNTKCARRSDVDAAGCRHLVKRLTNRHFGSVVLHQLGTILGANGDMEAAAVGLADAILPTINIPEVAAKPGPWLRVLFALPVAGFPGAQPPFWVPLISLFREISSFPSVALRL